MAARRGLLSSALILVLLCASPLAVLSAKKTAPANKSDIKYIRCDVCELMVKNLIKEVKKQREATAPKKLSEYSIIEIVEKICDPNRLEGEWIAKQDIVEDGTRLKLVEQETVGECGTECRTIAKACEEVMGDSDTDVAEALFKESTKRAQLSKLLCYELSGACKRKAPPVPKDRPVGEDFTPKDSKDLEVERLMQEMQGMGGLGGGMEMFKRDEMMQKMGMGDDDDDDDEEDDFTSPMKEHFAEDDAKNGLKFDKKSAEGAKAAPKDPASASTLADLTDSAKEAFDTASSKAKEALGSVVEVGKTAADALSKQAHQAAEAIGEKAGQVGEYISEFVSSFQGKKEEGAKSAEL